MMNGGRLSQSTAFMDAPPVSLALDTEETAGAADQAEPDLAVNIPEYPTLIAGSLLVLPFAASSVRWFARRGGKRAARRVHSLRFWSASQ
jgi:hypothetical protein